MEPTHIKDGITSLALGKELKEKARIEAAYQRMSLSAFVRSRIAIWLQCRDEIEQLSSIDDSNKGGE